MLEGYKTGGKNVSAALHFASFI